MSTDEERRKRSNADILERMKEPDYRASLTTKMGSFFPPRPVIKKNKKAVIELFGSDSKQNPDETCNS